MKKSNKKILIIVAVVFILLFAAGANLLAANVEAHSTGSTVVVIGLTWAEFIRTLYVYFTVFGSAILSAIAVINLVLDKKSDIQTKTLWVLVIALIPVTGSLVSLFVRPRLQKQL